MRTLNNDIRNYAKLVAATVITAKSAMKDDLLLMAVV